jgi:heat shock protein HslJ
MAGTMMACPDGGELERNYLQVLGRVNAFRLEGDTLSLLAGPEVVATFRAS